MENGVNTKIVGVSQNDFADISIRKFYFSSKPAANIVNSKYCTIYCTSRLGSNS